MNGVGPEVAVDDYAWRLGREESDQTRFRPLKEPFGQLLISLQYGLTVLCRKFHSGFQEEPCHGVEVVRHDPQPQP